MFGALITHRGIDIPLGKTVAEFPMESTWEAFTAQIDADYGLEFDVQPTADGRFAISHDKDLKRLTADQSVIKLEEVLAEEVSEIKIPGGRLCTLEELLEYIAVNSTSISALHLKASCQIGAVLQTLIAQLKPFEAKLANRLIIFDAKVETAKTLKEDLPSIQLAASVSDPFDIQRYGNKTGGTLLPPETVFQLPDLYSWVWLDEWDRLGEGAKRKTFVNAETVGSFHAAGFKVAVVSPELHATSPSLLGGEAHEDGCDVKLLRTRWLELGALQLEALCTDHASWIQSNLYPIG